MIRILSLNMLLLFLVLIIMGPTAQMIVYQSAAAQGSNTYGSSSSNFDINSLFNNLQNSFTDPLGQVDIIFPPESTDSMVPVNQPSSTDSMVPVNQPSSTDSTDAIAPQSDKSNDESTSKDKPSTTDSTDSTDAIAPQSDKSNDESTSKDKPSNVAGKKPVGITKIISPTNTNPSIEG